MKKIPKYSLHKPSGQARVRINGKTYYLGVYGTPASREKYDRIIATWLSGDKAIDRLKMTVAQLCLKYLNEHAKLYYRKRGRETSEVGAIKGALRPLVSQFAGLQVCDFGPSKLKKVRESMVAAGIVRKSINCNIGRIKRMFKWAVENELVEPRIFQALSAVSGLRFGRSDARDNPPVSTVSDEHIQAIKPFVGRHVWAMVQVQLHTGMRPGEVRLLRMDQLNTNGDVWDFAPSEHKTEHHGRKRIILIGPVAQQILSPFLSDDPQKYLFSPREARKEFDERRSTGRKSPMTPSQSRRQKKVTPKKQPGEFYSVTSYSRAIKTGCAKAGIKYWTPNQLRHNAATRIREEFGIEQARTILGHASGFTTEIYAEQDLETARKIVLKLG